MQRFLEFLSVPKIGSTADRETAGRLRSTSSVVVNKKAREIPKPVA